MKKIVSLLCVLVLAGAGCASPEPESKPVAPAPAPITAANEPATELAPTEPAPAEPAPTEPTPAASVEINISMDAGNFFFTPKEIKAAPGQTVNITINSNEGFHTFVIDAIDFKKSTKTAESFSFVAPSEPGSYQFYCDVGSHAAMGMVGTLIVE